MELVLLSQNGCAPCKIEKKFLENEGIELTEINLSEQPEKIEEYNVMGTPVTVLEDDGEEITRFNGFVPEKILEMAEYL